MKMEWKELCPCCAHSPVNRWRCDVGSPVARACTQCVTDHLSDLDPYLRNQELFQGGYVSVLNGPSSAPIRTPLAAPQVLANRPSASGTHDSISPTPVCSLSPSFSYCLPASGHHVLRALLLIYTWPRGPHHSAVVTHHSECPAQNRHRPRDVVVLCSSCRDR